MRGVYALSAFFNPRLSDVHIGFAVVQESKFAVPWTKCASVQVMWGLNAERGKNNFGRVSARIPALCCRHMCVFPRMWAPVDFHLFGLFLVDFKVHRPIVFPVATVPQWGASI